MSRTRTSRDRQIWTTQDKTRSSSSLRTLPMRMICAIQRPRMILRMGFTLSVRALPRGTSQPGMTKTKPRRDERSQMGHTRLRCHPPWISTRRVPWSCRFTRRACSARSSPSSDIKRPRKMRKTRAQTRNHRAPSPPTGESTARTAKRRLSVPASSSMPPTPSPSRSTLP